MKDTHRVFRLGLLSGLLGLALNVHCGGGGSADSPTPTATPTPAPKTYVYVANSTAVDVFQMDSTTGALTTATGTKGSNHYTLSGADAIVNIGNQYLCVASTGMITSFEIESDGTLTTSWTHSDSAIHASGLAASSDGKFLYASGGKDLLVYGFDHGQMIPLDGMPFTVDNSVSLGRLKMAGGFLFGTDVASGNGLVSWQLNTTTGVPTSTILRSYTSGTLSGSLPTFQDIVPNADGSVLYAVASSDEVDLIKTSIRGGGLLSEIDSAFAATSGGNTYAAALHPTGKYLYVENGRGDVSVLPVQADGSLGTETNSMPTFHRGTFRNLAIDPSGTFLYGSNDDADSSAFLQVFKVNPATGGLTSLDSQFATSGSNPKSIAFSVIK